MAKRSHALWHAKHPLQKIEIVRALVEQHATTFADPGCTPTAGGVVGLAAEPVGDYPVDAADFTERTFLDQLANLLVGGVGALVEHYGKDLPPVLMGGQEPLAVGLVDGDGFFDQHVQTRAKRSDADRDMEIVRCRDKDRIDRTGGDHRIRGRETLDAWELVKAGGVTITYGRKLDSVDFAREDALRMRCPHVAKAYNAKANPISGRRALGENARDTDVRHSALLVRMRRSRGLGGRGAIPQRALVYVRRAWDVRTNPMQISTFST
jgi:hypothetical protein